jgi:hypothetical protein
METIKDRVYSDELREKLEQFLMFVSYKRYVTLEVKFKPYQLNIKAKMENYTTLILHINQYIYEFTSKRIRDDYTILYYLSNLYKVNEPSNTTEKLTLEKLKIWTTKGKAEAIKFREWK